MWKVWILIQIWDIVKRESKLLQKSLGFSLAGKRHNRKATNAKESIKTLFIQPRLIKSNHLHVRLILFISKTIQICFSNAIIDKNILAMQGLNFHFTFALRELS